MEEKVKAKYVMYTSDDSGINGKLIGKVLYSGTTSKGSLTDGKIYKCLGLSFGELRIIDDSGEAYYYHTKPSWKDKTAQFIVIEDDSLNKILSAFISGDESRTPYEKQIEKEYVVGMISVGLNRDRNEHVNKSKTVERGLVKLTPEVEKHQEKLLQEFARIITEDVIAGATKYRRNPNMFDSPVGTEFYYTKGEKYYKVKRLEENWEVSTVTRIKKEEILTFFCILPDSLGKISNVKMHMTNSEQF